VSSRNSIIRRSAIILAFLALAFASVFPSHSISVAYADGAFTNGKATGAGEGGGNGNVKANQDTFAGSTASSHGHHSAAGETIAGTNTWVDQGDETNNTHVKLSTRTRAAAKSSKTGLEATASADTTGEAISNEGSSNARTNSFNGGTATAKSTKKGGIASASSTSGGYALANAVLKTVEAYVPDGISSTYNQGKKLVAVAYTNTGSYSIAITKGKSARAMTGTNEDIGALSVGNIKSIIHSAMYAEAGANPHYAYAKAYSSIDAMASNAYGMSKGFGEASAYAEVRRSGPKLTVTVVAANARNGEQCGGNGWWRRTTAHRYYDNCVLERKVIYLKKTTLHTHAFRVTRLRTAGHKNYLH
jgi:hypothetical protein